MAGKRRQESRVRFPEMLGALGPSTAFLATGSSSWGSQVTLLCCSWGVQLQAVWVQPDMPTIHTHFLDWREGFFAQMPTLFPDSPLAPQPRMCSLCLVVPSEVSHVLPLASVDADAGSQWNMWPLAHPLEN